ncbi:MAG: type II secretion system protein GspK [Planctomycetaceae bacterium]|nr:type II secretion system protein GspK [Planctomycetaceae bacterium]
MLEKRYSNSRGTVIAVVLVVIVILSLAALTLVKLMQAEQRGARYNMRQTQVRYLAESGIDALRVLLMYNDEDLLDLGGLYDNPNELCGVPVTDNLRDVREVGRFSVVSPWLDEYGMPTDIRYGFADESAKIDLRMIWAYEQEKTGVGREILMNLPGMDEYIADAILDWIDDDDETRDYGAEAEYYESLDVPYRPRNAMIESLDELLLVAGVTPTLLHGADWNRNGLVDLGEPDPLDFQLETDYDNSEGLLDCGLCALLTIRSAESAEGSDGSDKINVNSDDLEELQQQLSSKLNNEDWVNYIIAYRLFGETNLSTSEEYEDAGSSSSNRNGGPGGSSTDRSSENASGGSTSDSASNESSDNQPGGNPPGDNPPGDSQPGDDQPSDESNRSFDLSQEPKAKIFSVLDLVGGSLQVQYQGESSTETLESPFTEASLASDIPTLLGSLRVSDGAFSRINIDEAPRGVLLAIPGMTDDALDAILANRIPDPVELAEAEIDEMQYELWPLLLDYVDLDTMKRIAPYITSKGTVCSAQIVGRFDAKSPASRLHVWFDTSEKPAKIIRVQDLSHLGPGYTPEMLGVNQDTRSIFSTGNAVSGLGR